MYLLEWIVGYDLINFGHKNWPNNIKVNFSHGKPSLLLHLTIKQPMIYLFSMEIYTRWAYPGSMGHVCNGGGGEIKVVPPV